jgi:pimeloyl-ACP methyl ester carboxylesterase
MKRLFQLKRAVRGTFCIGATALVLQVHSAHAQDASARLYETKSADAGGVRLHYIDFGGEGVPIILVPAVTREATHYAPLGPLLTGGNRVLAVTRRGDGESQDPGDGYDARTQARDFLHFMDALGIQKAVFVSNVGDEITYLAEEHPHRIAGLVYLGGPARGPTAAVAGADPSVSGNALGRYFMSVFGVRPGYDGYVPRYLRSSESTIRAPALVFAGPDGMKGVEGESLPLMLVGSPLAAGVVSAMLPEDGRGHFERLANDRQYRDQALSQIPDSIARTYFQRLAGDHELQAQVQQYHEETIIPAEEAHWESFKSAFVGNLTVVQLDAPVSGYEYHATPGLIVPHIRQFLEEIGARR